MAMPFFWSHFSIPGMLLQSTNARVSLCSGLLRLTVTVPYSSSSSLPIIWMAIVENGIGLHEKPEADGMIHDDARIEYFANHIAEMKKAVELDGVTLLGYCPWGPIDIVSASTGEMDKRYGFIYVDKNNKGEGTLERSPKKSFYWYKRVIDTNGENISKDIELNM